MVALGTLPGQAVSEGLGVNADGSVVVGYDGYGGCGNNVAFRWTQATGQVSLGFPPGGGVTLVWPTPRMPTARSSWVMPAFAAAATKPAGGPPRLVGWRSAICREPQIL